MHITYCFVPTTAVVTRTRYNVKLQCTVYPVYNAFLPYITNLCTFWVQSSVTSVLYFRGVSFKSGPWILSWFFSDSAEWMARCHLEIRHNRFPKNPFKLTKSSHNISFDITQTWDSYAKSNVKWITIKDPCCSKYINQHLCLSTHAAEKSSLHKLEANKKAGQRKVVTLHATLVWRLPGTAGRYSQGTVSQGNIHDN